MQSQLSRNILQTIIYYDILNYPLTSFEIRKYLIAEESCTLGEVVDALEDRELKNQIEEYRGFYFLPGKKELVERRIQNDKNSIQKFEIAEKAARWLRFVPFVRMVAVTGTLAMKNCEKDSDIDFIIILEKGKIFTGRLLVTAMIHLLGRRRYGKKIKNRICLNYFIAKNTLEIERQDLFAANEYTFMYLIFGLDIFQDFCQANARWINRFKPNWDIPELKPARYFIEHSKFSQSFQKMFESLINFFGGDRIETWLKKKQISRIKQNPLTHKPGAYVRYSDQNLIFLPEPQGMRIEEEWQRRRRS